LIAEELNVDVTKVTVAAAPPGALCQRFPRRHDHRWFYLRS